MALSDITRRIGIHLLRIASYIIYPVGVFFFVVLIVETVTGDPLDLTQIPNIRAFLEILLGFLGPPLIILFLHPPSKASAGSIQNGPNITILAQKRNYAPHIAIVVVLAIVGFVSAVYMLMFIFLIFSNL